MKTLKFLQDTWSKKSDQIIDNAFGDSKCPMEVVRRQSFIDYLLGKRKYDLAAYVAVQYFCIVAPLDNSITRIFTDVANIPPFIYDKKEQKFVENHPLQQLLEKPNFDDTTEQFMEAFTAFYKITGDSYVIANSIDINSEPVMLFVIPPQNVEIEQSGEGNILSYTVNENIKPVKYDAISSLNGQGIRYIATLENDTASEIYHSISFNPLSACYNIKGRSPLTSVYYELEQFISSNTHNLSRLKRGTTLDGIFKTPDKLSETQFTELQAHLDEYWGSAENAGRPFLADGGLEFQPNPRENKDMDYSKMRKDLRETIYNHFGIPLPFVSAETMTLANMEASTLRMYDESVLPTLNRLLADLTKFLIPRYKNSENLKIWYDQDTISALEPRRNEQLKAKRDLGVYTINELREMDRAQPIDGGQNIYGQITEVPIAVDSEDEFTTGTELEQGQQARQQGQQQGQSDQPTQQNAANVRAILKRYKDTSNKPLFNDDEIDKLINEFDKQTNGLLSTEIYKLSDKPIPKPLMTNDEINKVLKEIKL
jgi:HK97 family phage portal protein